MFAKVIRNYDSAKVGQIGVIKTFKPQKILVSFFNKEVEIPYNFVNINYNDNDFVEINRNCKN